MPIVDKLKDKIRAKGGSVEHVTHIESALKELNRLEAEEAEEAENAAQDALNEETLTGN